jgi:hypothetical protein
MTNFKIKGTELEAQEAGFFFEKLHFALLGIETFGQIENERVGEDPIWTADRESLRAIYRELRAANSGDRSVESYRKARKTFGKAAGLMNRVARRKGSKVSVYAERGILSDVDPRVATDVAICFH